MIREYFKWLKENKGIDYKAPIHIALLLMQLVVWLMLPLRLLYICCRWGYRGMHGADRIGGLLTANALVFGQIVGKNSLSYIQNNIIEIDKNYI